MSLRTSRQSRHGLTLLELTFSITVTAIVGAALAATLGAVSAGVDTHKDTRSHIVRAHAAQSRLGAYIVPSRAILFAEHSTVALWFNDSRQSDTVHGSEIRWLIYDSSAGSVDVHFLRFPSNWSEVERATADREHHMNSDWLSVLDWYRSQGLITSVTLVDGVAGMVASIDEVQPLESRHLMLRVFFEGAGSEIETVLGGTLMRHRPPVW